MASKISKRKDTGYYILRFVNPVDKTNNNTHLATSKDLNKLIKQAEELDYNFYSANPYLVPSGISLDKRDKRFRIYTRFGYIEEFGTLNEAIKCKLEVIEDLISPKYNKSKFGLLINS